MSGMATTTDDGKHSVYPHTTSINGEDCVDMGISMKKTLNKQLGKYENTEIAIKD